MKLPIKLPRIRLPSWGSTAAALDLVCLLAGAVMLARGLWLIYPPAMWVICGGLLILCGVLPPGRRGE